MKEYLFRLKTELGIEVVYFDIKKNVFLSDVLRGKIKQAIDDKNLQEIIIKKSELRELYDVVETPEGYYDGNNVLDDEAIFNAEKEKCKELKWVSCLDVVFICNEI